MNWRDRLRQNPYLGNGLLAIIGILFVASLSGSGGNPAIFLKSLLYYLMILAGAVGVVVLVIALGAKLGSNASSAVVVQQHKPKANKKGKGKRKG